MKITVGIDPDSKASGVAIYQDGKLARCECMTIMAFVEWCCLHDHHDVTVHIEDLNAISSNAFHVKGLDSLPVKLKKAQHVGQCKQVQVELERICYHFGFDVKKHKVSKMWKKDKKQFEQVTGWADRSNEDSRSAAYFGFLGGGCG